MYIPYLVGDQHVEHTVDTHPKISSACECVFGGEAVKGGGGWGCYGMVRFTFQNDFCGYRREEAEEICQGQPSSKEMTVTSTKMVGMEVED